MGFSSTRLWMDVWPCQLSDGLLSRLRSDDYTLFAERVSTYGGP